MVLQNKKKIDKSCDKTMKKCENESFYNQLFKWTWLSNQFNWKNDCRVIYPYITSKRRTIKTLTKMAPKSNFKIWKWFDFRHQNESIFIRLKDSIVKNYIFKSYQACSTNPVIKIWKNVKMNLFIISCSNDRVFQINSTEKMILVAYEVH